VAKRPSFLSYENEIRLFALLLILLMLLVNWGTSSLFQRSSSRLRDQEGSLLLIVGELASTRILVDARNLLDPTSRNRVNQLCNDIALRYHLRRLIVVGRNNQILSSSEPEEIGKKPDWLGLSTDDVERAWSGMGTLSRMYRRPGEGDYQSYLVPLQNSGLETTSALIIAEKDQSYLQRLNRDARIEFLVRTTSYGIAILFVSFFIGAILRPYRRMRKAAVDVVPSPNEDSKDVEFVVKAFEDTICQLQEKERVLAKLHAEAERRAGDLARYNEYILGSIASGVVNSDERGVVTYMNRVAKEVLAPPQNPEAGVGKHLESLLDRSNEELLKAFLTALREQERDYSAEVEWVKDGRRHWMGISSSPLRDAEGKSIGTTFLLNDLTEIKRLQEEMLIKGRLATLGEVSAGIAHEFRNSLGAITGFATLLRKKTTQDDPRREVVEGIVAEANQLESAVSQFLKFASPEPLHLSPVRLNDLISECCRASEERCRQIGVNLDLRLSPQIGEVSLDAAMFRRALLNLILNGIEAMPGKEAESPAGTLTVETRRDPDGVSLTITDTGCGIPKTALDRVFTPFFTTKEKGAGMGLAIVQKIVVSHGGRISLESEEGHGTAVKIHFPSG
jgi:PAS domain S-box-containing protein